LKSLNSSRKRRIEELFWCLCGRLPAHLFFGPRADSHRLSTCASDCLFTFQRALGRSRRNGSVREETKFPGAPISSGAGRGLSPSRAINIYAGPAEVKLLTEKFWRAPRAAPGRPGPPRAASPGRGMTTFSAFNTARGRGTGQIP